MKNIAAMLAVCLLVAAPASATVLAQWTFETSIPATAGPHAPEVGSGAAVGSHAGAAVYSSPAGNGDLHSFSSNTWAIGDYYEFSTSTAGFTGIAFQWDQASSNTGPRDFDLKWSTDGVIYTTLVSHMVPVGFFSTTIHKPELSNGPVAGPAALDNQATVYFRLMMTSTVSVNGGTVGSGGTDRVDNVTITGVPEPTTLALLALGGLSLIRRRR